MERREEIKINLVNLFAKTPYVFFPDYTMSIVRTWINFSSWWASLDMLDHTAKHYLDGQSEIIFLHNLEDFHTSKMLSTFSQVKHARVHMAAQLPIPTTFDIAIKPLHAYFQCSQNQSRARKGFHFSTHCGEDVGKLSAENHDDNLEVNET